MKAFPVSLALAFCSVAAFADSSYDAHITEINKGYLAKQAEGPEAVLNYLNEQGRALVRDYPDQPDGYEMLKAVFQSVDAKKAEEVLKLIDTPKAPDDVREVVADFRAKREMLGKPLSLKFTAVDGRQVDLASMKGKVVLVDFWATFCPPCLAELPEVKETYAKLHPQGFEIVGISLDQDKERLESFLKAKEMPWPQYCDGESWLGKIVEKFGVRQIPTMWLVDKKGNLVDLEAREEFPTKVEKLLAE